MNTLAFIFLLGPLALLAVVGVIISIYSGRKNQEAQRSTSSLVLRGVVYSVGVFVVALVIQYFFMTKLR